MAKKDTPDNDQPVRIRSPRFAPGSSFSEDSVSVERLWELSILEALRREGELSKLFERETLPDKDGYVEYTRVEVRKTRRKHQK